MRVYDPIAETLTALKGSNIEIIVDIPNDNLQALTDPNAAANWVNANIVAYSPDVKFKYINVGNEVSPSNVATSKFAPFLLPALQNVQQAITKFQLQVKVSTAIETGILTNTYPPSESVFRGDISDFINPLIGFLKQNNLPVLANIYPYFGYLGDPAHVPLPYALFTQQNPDPSGYHNLFDAMLDATYYAVEKAGGENLPIVVSESGWPSAGGDGASIDNGGTYYTNLISHVKSEAQPIGVCYGRNGNNLPSAQDVVNFYKANGITNMRVYDPIAETLTALKGSNIEIIVDIPNDNLEALTDPNAAANWVNANIVAYSPDVKFKYINVGNEVSPSNVATSKFAPFLLPALQNVQQAITKFQLQVKVSTAIETGILTNTYPPSESVFRGDISDFINPLIGFLKQNNLPVLANIYPYFGYLGDPAHVPLPYALFTQQNPDPSGYHNLFDAMLDATYYAVEKAGGENLPIVVSESGWPSAGGDGASIDNGGTYYTNLISHVKSGAGTPHKPGTAIETYLFAMFDENIKIGAETEKHFGVFHPDKTPKYNLKF
ncbi:glucan endo-1,3-beta-glucosidase, acidic isoform gi9 [Nicotiana attenuata]|uniref:Glucan endo-1,3-beta-glucosidase, acidic isoform gi9 n=1 Tax=Nicotiana attenuata TaxID=49451 RepID=A0A1J6KH61_NICAT|nr:glucan endo-1,3-beta-glucosidase, acidic isoform gi9 [Nicotiana attenuata]